MDEYRIVAALSWYPTRIEQAKSLLANPGQRAHADVCPAMCVLMLGVALEEAVRSKISERIANAAAAGVPGEVYESIRSATLRQRMTGLAAIVGRGFFASPDRRAHARALHELIDFRNELLHIEEHVRVLDEHDDIVRLVGDEKLEVTLTLPVGPWKRIGVADAKQCAEAVHCYVTEVLEPLADTGKYWTLAV